MTHHENAREKASGNAATFFRSSKQESPALPSQEIALQTASKKRHSLTEKSGVGPGQQPSLTEAGKESFSRGIRQAVEFLLPFSSTETERSAPSNPSQETLQASLSLLPLTKEDAQALAQCSALCFLDPRDPPWNASSYRAILKERSQGWKVVGKANEIVAFILLLDTVEAWEVLKLAVRPSFRRQGIARWLLTQALTATAERALILEVMATNEAALALYKGLGFQEIARRPGYYRDPGFSSVDAIILKANPFF